MEFSKFFLNQVQGVQNQLLKLLEKNDSVKLSQNFEATSDLTQLSCLGDGLPEEKSARVSNLFGRLHPYFEAGVLLKYSQEDLWSPQRAFQKGFIFELSSFEKEMTFSFPMISLVSVLKARSQHVVKDLGLDEYLNNNNISALVFRPHHEYLFLVLSELADPWLKNHIEKIQSKTLLLLSDYE
jgi:hypothetical protein